ncbi:MAG: AzlD domain-containing protein [Haloarculaceae archaeon]
MSSPYGPVAVWGVVAVAGVLTFAIRFSFIYLFSRIGGVPPRLQRVLRYVPAGVFAALTVPSLVVLSPTPAATLLDPRLLAGVVAGAVAWRSENVLLTVLVGMAALHAFRFLL